MFTNLLRNNNDLGIEKKTRRYDTDKPLMYKVWIFCVHNIIGTTHFKYWSRVKSIIGKIFRVFGVLLNITVFKTNL